MTDSARRELAFELPALLLEADALGRCRFASRRLLALIGGSPEEAARAWDEALDPGDRERWVAACGAGSVACEVGVRDAGGARRRLRLEGSPLGGAAPEGGVLVTATDVTELRAAQEALSVERARFATILELTSDVLWEHDLVGGGVVRSTRALRGIGYEPSELGGAEWFREHLHPDDRERTWSSLRAVIEHGGSHWAGDFRLRRPDGSWAYYQDHARVLRDADGRALRVIGCAHDVTRQTLDEEALDLRAAELERSRAELERQRRILDSVLAGMGDGVVVADATGRFVVFNPAAEKIAGVGAISSDPATWSDDYGIFKPDGKTKFRLEELPLYRAMQGESTDQVEMLLRNPRVPPEGVAVSITGRPLRDANGDVVGGVVVFRDVTERKRLEAELRQSQKMEALGRLAGGVAHDFNNLLQIILGYAEVALARARAADLRDQSDLLEIQKAGTRGAALTRQLLAFSRKQILAPERLDVNAVLGDVVPMLRRLIGEDIELATDLAPALPPILADSGQLAQVIVNLAVNARDAMPEGGTLTLETAAAEDGMRLVIRDTGHGMDAETQARAFEPFFTTKGPGRGTGLGLATVYGIVNQMGGSIALASAIGRGTTFTIALPHAPRDGAEPRTPPPHARPGPPSNEVVLLAEDDALVRRLARQVLEQQGGFVVLEAQDGVAALERADRHDGPIALLVADLVMPQMGGRELARRLLERRPAVRVLLVSGYPGDAPPRGDQAAFLAKPFSAEALLRKVRELLASRVKNP